jgi:hypothetical protein
MRAHALHACPPVERKFGTVFSEETIDRLATMNRATRLLREMGYAIETQDLALDTPLPIVSIRRDRQSSIAPLLDIAGSRWWRQTPTGKRGFAHIFDITVTWEDA